MPQGRGDFEEQLHLTSFVYYRPVVIENIIPLLKNKKSENSRASHCAQMEAPVGQLQGSNMIWERATQEQLD